jgi:hypothetical protein
VIRIETEPAGDDVAGHLTETSVLGVRVGTHPRHGLTDTDAELHHDHPLRLEQLGAVLDRRA